MLPYGRCVYKGGGVVVEVVVGAMGGGGYSTTATPKGNNFHLIMVSVYNRLPEQMCVMSGRRSLQSEQIRVCLHMQEEAGSHPQPAYAHTHTRTHAQG